MNTYQNEAFLVNVANEIELEVIQSLLKSYEIPVRIKYKESGAYLNIFMGSTSTGIDIFVPESKLNEAQEIIKGNYNLEEENIKESNNKRKISWRNIAGWILIIFFFLPVIAGVILLLIYLINNK
jgi:hypothetical protein